MIDPDPWGENNVEWWTETRYLFSFEILSIISLFENHDQGNMPIWLIPGSKVFERKGKFLPKG